MSFPARGDMRHFRDPRPGPFAALWRDLVGSWRHAIARSRSDPIDDATLRDLGMSRSELGSFQAEADGLVAPTRLRVLNQRGAGV